MADYKKYKVGITAKENWASDISFEQLDYTLWSVNDGGDGCGYIALKDNIGVLPNSDVTTWRKATEAGQSIYDLAVKYHHFVGTEEEFEAQYQQALSDAISAAQSASAIDTQVRASEQQRVVSEQGRVSAENTRLTSESARVAEETERQSAENTRVSNEEARVSSETERISAETERQTAESVRVRETAAAITDANTARDQADASATRANTAATNAESKAALANDAATLANTKAQLANDKAALAETAATNANEKATLAQQKATYAETQGDYAKAQGDYAKAQGDTALADHERAETDHTMAESDHAAVEVYVDSLGVFDLSKHNAVGGVLATYADLSAALTALNTLDSKYKYGGMSIKFVKSSDNKYIQARCMAQNFTTDVTQWQGVDDTPTAGSENLVKSGGVAAIVDGKITEKPSIWSTGNDVLCRMATAQYISMNGFTARLVPINGGETIFAKGNSNGSGIAVVKTFSESSSWTAYDFATGEDAVHSVSANNSTTFVCPSDAKLLIVAVKNSADKNLVPTELKINGTDAYNGTPSELSVVKQKVDDLEDVVYDKEYKWCVDDDFNNVIEEFYIPNASTVIGTGSYINVVGISASSITLVINTSSNDEIIRISKKFNGTIDSNPDGSYDYYFGRKGKAAITTLYKKNSSNSLLERIGYIKFKDTTFSKTSTGAAIIDTSIVDNIDNSPIIKAMINDGRQLVLSGDSHFGAFKAQNILQDLLQGMLGIQVYNIGFGGCRMAWRSSDGSHALDAYTFCDVIDAVLSGDFTKQRNSVDESGDYPPQVANLEAIDIDKPMQWIVEYCVNDHTGGSPIGNIYEDDGTFNVSDSTEVVAKLATFDRTTLLGALNYGLLKLYAAKPKLAEVQVTGGARVIDNPDAQGRRMRYNKQNSLGLVLDQYNEALSNDCNHIGIRYADYPNNGLYNAFAMREGDEGITTSGSVHNNALGFCYMSKVIALMSRYYLG